ncbi:unnamed protein product [Protopolystoma xenopodis]|uniref:Uncharacterized protein n=1 Tax=Protopolystoma xenopodis TaxID=117903 RepID=A0A448WR86_9PLAT|nr:unnamed protein product [Protopolystoma xenopodis]
MCEGPSFRLGFKGAYLFHYSLRQHHSSLRVPIGRARPTAVDTDTRSIYRTTCRVSGSGWFHTDRSCHILFRWPSARVIAGPNCYCCWVRPVK